VPTSQKRDVGSAIGRDHAGDVTARKVDRLRPPGFAASSRSKFLITSFCANRLMLNGSMQLKIVESSKKCATVHFDAHRADRNMRVCR
jgi:hypothetical protein